MTEQTPHKAIDAARAYEKLQVPALFLEWAPRLLDAAGARPGHSVLDVACGTGVVAREAATRVGSDGCVAGIDAMPAMLVVAKELSPAVEFQEGDAEALPFDDDSFDAVVCQFGLMWFDNQDRAIREILRVLKPGGRFAAAVWKAADDSADEDEEVALFRRMAGDAAANAMKAPVNLGGEEQLTDLFEAAGASAVDVATITGTACYPNIRAMVEADLRGWLPVVDVYLEDSMIEDILREAENVLAGYRLDDGTVRFDSTAHIVTGTK